VSQRPLAGLVRVSRVGLRDVESDRFHASDDQVSEIKRYAAAHGVDAEILPPELDISGGLPLEKRPSLLAAVEGVERGEYNGIIVSYLSRLGRNVREQLRCWDRVEAAGGKVIVVREGIDTTTASGRLHRNLLLSIAEHEREMHAEQFARRRASSVERGIWRQRQTPLGYSRHPETRRLTPNDRADDVRRAFRHKAADVPVSEIARRLDMTASGVRQLLQNRVYLGELRDGRNVNPEAHPPIVTPAEFDAAQSKVARPARSGGPPALLAGLVRCAGCGHVMSRGITSTPVYSCHRDHSGARCPEPAGITVARLDEYVEAIALAELDKLTVERTDADSAAVAVREAAYELETYLEAVSAATIGVDAFRAGAEKRRAALEAAQRDYGLAQTGPRAPNGATGAEVWKALDGHERNRLLRSLLAAVVVRRAGRGKRVPLADRVRVISHGTPLELPARRGGEAAGMVPIPFADLDDEGLLGMLAGEDRL
jgi:site-specific DNA recombinase